MSERDGDLVPFGVNFDGEIEPPREDAGYVQTRPKPTEFALSYVGRQNPCAGATVKPWRATDGEWIRRLTCSQQAESNTALCSRCREREQRWLAELRERAQQQQGRATTNRRAGLE